MGNKKIVRHNPSNQNDLPQVYKEAEYSALLELIKAGIWRNTNLCTALHIAESTIIEWKKRPEVQQVHRETILRFAKRRQDIEKILSEIGIESTIEPASLTQINNYINLPDEQLDKLLTAKAREVGVLDVVKGKGETPTRKPSQVLETTS